jgi:hypothetical protein
VHSAIAPISSPTVSPIGRPALGVVVLCVSPLAATRRVVEAVGASVAAGNRTLVSFPAGATRRTRAEVGRFVTLLGRDRVSIVTGAGLAEDPDAELAHLVSVEATAVGMTGGPSVPHGQQASAARRAALADLFSDPFPVEEWTALLRRTTSTGAR